MKAKSNGTKWTPARRAKFRKTVAAKKANGNGFQIPDSLIPKPAVKSGKPTVQRTPDKVALARELVALVGRLI